MPMVTIQLVREVIADAPAEKKAEMGRRIAATISEVTGLPETSVWIVFDEVAAADWHVGQKTVQALRAEAGKTA